MTRYRWQKTDWVQFQFEERKHLLDPRLCHRPHVRIPWVRIAHVIPDDRTAACKDTAYIPCEASRHPAIQDRREYSEDRHQAEPVIREVELLGVPFDEGECGVGLAGGRDPVWEEIDPEQALNGYTLFVEPPGQTTVPASDIEDPALVQNVL